MARIDIKKLTGFKEINTNFIAIILLNLIFNLKSEVKKIVEVQNKLKIKKIAYLRTAIIIQLEFSGITVFYLIFVFPQILLFVSRKRNKSKVSNLSK